MNYLSDRCAMACLLLCCSARWLCSGGLRFYVRCVSCAGAGQLLASLGQPGSLKGRMLPWLSGCPTSHWPRALNEWSLSQAKQPRHGDWGPLWHRQELRRQSFSPGTFPSPHNADSANRRTGEHSITHYSRGSYRTGVSELYCPFLLLD
ncbi:hypothetical protein BT67DRAFT_22901 [Trichocladium antarcticum]|uniref:Secreted protein n=1 Tax=Trichocladium antarcticum TaxID=1450529 RepID=A0AAN6UT86_9PEZI|nr:hypothetical protein BT67DRAFT_22901 [Trichocladium antarcticum]